ncbi:MAG: endolytic transglycosylase MltG [Bacilli bacterium]|jgi:UPF0755 protein|nr:endolytic transglycosylase MltG [Bacilli bacterium]
MSKKNIILIIIVLLLGGLLFFINYATGAVDKNDHTSRNFEIKKDTSGDAVINDLKTSEFIKNSEFAKLYIRISHKNNFKAGVYELKKDQNLIQIINHLNNADNITGVSLTFVEGKRLTDYGDVISEKLNITKEAFLKKCNDVNFINNLKTKYEILKDFNFNNKELYLLEGLLAPDTYVVNDKISVDELIERMISQSNKIYLANKKAIDKSKLNVHDIYTLASIIELEANNYEDRMIVASVFMNRIKDHTPLGSDVTTYYGLQISMAARDLTKSELAQNNGYNTRSNMLGLPIGPIGAPSTNSIRAVLNYKETSYLYFVSDKNGKIYPAKTYAEHNKIIEDLKNKNLWFTYDN